MVPNSYIKIHHPSRSYKSIVYSYTDIILFFVSIEYVKHINWKKSIVLEKHNENEVNMDDGIEK